jgi:hypothetical protein
MVGFSSAEQMQAGEERLARQAAELLRAMTFREALGSRA